MTPYEQAYLDGYLQKQAETPPAPAASTPSAFEGWYNPKNWWDAATKPIGAPEPGSRVHNAWNKLKAKGTQEMGDAAKKEMMPWVLGLGGIGLISAVSPWLANMQQNKKMQAMMRQRAARPQVGGTRIYRPDRLNLRQASPRPVAPNTAPSPRLPR